MDNEAGRTAAGLEPPLGRRGAWSLNTQSWRVHWSPEARAIHDFDNEHAPTVWEALEFVDPPDRARLFEAALRLGRERLAPSFRVVVGLTSARGRRGRVVITGFRTGSDAVTSIKGTITELVASALEPPLDAPAPAASQHGSFRDWEVFAAALPHELKTPVGIARGLAEAVRSAEKGMTPAGASRMDRVVQRLRQLDEVLDGLLALAPSALPPQKTRVNLSEIALNALAVLRDQQPHRQVECTVRPDLWVHGDEGLLRVALENLLRNAWKFTEKQAAPQVTVRAESRDGAKVICVEDNGIGFDMAHASRLFIPFERLHGQREFEGSGLGLAIARTVIERHGGSIWAESSPGAGARFFVALPGRVPDQAPPSSQDRAS